MARTASIGGSRPRGGQAGKSGGPRSPSADPLDFGARSAALIAEMQAQTEGSFRVWSMLLATQLGLMEGATRHINARVPARLLEAATERAGTEAVTEVVTRALAGLATRSEIGPWLAEHWGELRDIDPAVAAEIDNL